MLHALHRMCINTALAAFVLLALSAITRLLTLTLRTHRCTINMYKLFVVADKKIPETTITVKIHVYFDRRDSRPEYVDDDMASGMKG